MRILTTNLFILMLFFGVASNFIEANEPTEANESTIMSSVEKEVAAVEKAFAKTMSDRDFEAFKSFIHPDAVFMSSKGPLRGKPAVSEAWKGYYKESSPPFSWEPESVLVIASGELALSTGPVRNSDGEIFAYYTSTWKKDRNGKWLIVLDKGQKYCSEDKKNN
ncbi:DUF4440 domain-containing protein [Aliikangiella sp. G2MR2-5]|uniref:YybH family protein n=1 Tax=Aliikangiella sp. G2MR2-5 TaxID=2788943 RepID=UPI0018AC133A|nr:nuclear transport factor 2 family protein [Aliikangiella sp. G2MR2-5]